MDPPKRALVLASTHERRRQVRWEGQDKEGRATLRQTSPIPPAARAAAIDPNRKFANSAFGGRAARILCPVAQPNSGKLLGTETPPFDVIRGADKPFSGFGDPLARSESQERTFLAQAEQAKDRMQTAFQLPALDPGETCAALDQLLRDMRDQGWSPTDSNLNFWVTDLGCVLTWAVLMAFHGEIILRSDRVLDHLSLWWESAAVEAFPFHHALKCVSAAEGESFAAFFAGLRVELSA